MTMHPPGRLRQIFSMVNEYEAVYHGQKRGVVLETAQLEARKNFFGDSWSIYMHTQRRRSLMRRGGVFSGRGLSGHFILAREPKRKLASGLTKEQALRVLRKYDENPERKALTGLDGQAYDGPYSLSLTRTKPSGEKTYWRDALTPRQV